MPWLTFETKALFCITRRYQDMRKGLLQLDATKHPTKQQAKDVEDPFEGVLWDDLQQAKAMQTMNRSISHTHTHTLSLYIYIYIYVCACVSPPHTHTHACTHAHTHAQTYARTHLRTHARMYARSNAHTHAPTHAGQPACVNNPIKHTGAHWHALAHTGMHWRAHTHTLTHIDMH